LTSQGDLRKAINHLQLTCNGYGDIVPENVYKLCDKPHPMVIKDIFLACYDKNIQKAIKYLEILREKGYSSSDISLSMVNTLKSPQMTGIDEKTRIEYMKEISYASLIITKGVDSALQLTGSIAKLCQ
jgi:replication factor C subunit 2/4